MFNFFNGAKTTNELTTEQENLTIADNNQSMEPEHEQKQSQPNEQKPKSAHGENGVCCGGCGG